jgi:formylglycine-generating enzyme required for sulfatase activity
MNRGARLTAEKASLRLQVGGTLVPGRDIYIARPEDDLLFELLRGSEYVNILSSRQVGKSSLMLRTAFRLREIGIRFAVIDLTALGTPDSARSYFRGLVGEIARQLGLQFDADGLGRDDADTGTHTQQFIRFFREVITTRLDEPVVIFLDEIDSTLKLSFTDDLFTALRSMYNERALVQAYQRIAICLVGVATPDELIKDRRTTPYNVGKTLWLGDFDVERDDLSPLLAVLSEDPSLGPALLVRVLHWTGGHPFLTTRLCQDLHAAGIAVPDDVDRFVGQRYAALEGLNEDVHVQQILRFVRERLTDGLASFNLYERILKGEKERDQPSLAHAELKLSGLVKRDRHGLLIPRNLIYARLFNLDWVRKSRPKQELTRARRIAYGAVTVLVAAVVFGGYYFQSRVVPLQQQERARQELAKLQVTLTLDVRGFKNVSLPAQDTKAVLQRALPYLETLGSGRDGRGLALEFSSAANFDPRVLAQFMTLRRLVISDPKLADLGPIAALVGLQELDISSTSVIDLAPLARLAGLKHLSAVMTGAVNLAPLADLKNLEVLELSNTPVKDLWPLAGMHNLRQLDVSNTPVESLVPLAGLIRLEELDVSRTQVKDLSPLKNLPALHHLAMDGLGIRDFAADRHGSRITVLQDPSPVRPGVAVRPGEGFRDCPKCPQMVVVPAGRFVMGSPDDEKSRSGEEGPQHEVSIPKAIAVARYEVRFDEWALCVQDGACQALSDAGFGRGARPAILVSRYEAKAYATWLSKTSGKTYRLLSEAEWEYAARGGTSTARFWGEDPDQACAYANVFDETMKSQEPGASNYDGHNCSDGYPYAAPAGSFGPNGLGLYDVIGNVWEWTEDCYHETYRGAPADGSVWNDDQCSAYVLRGGSWNGNPQNARSAKRYGFDPGNRAYILGFRVARTLP